MKKNIFMLFILVLPLVSCKFGKDKKTTHGHHQDSKSIDNSEDVEFKSPRQLVEGLKLEDAYYVIPGNGVKMAAAYGTLTNTTDEIIEIRALRARFFKNLEIHQTIKKDGLSMMEPIEKLKIDAGESVHLKPGGMHFMLLNVQQEIEEGTSTQLVFQSVDGKTIEFNFPSK